MVDSNQPPAAIIELDQADAELMMQNCTSNIRLALGLMQSQTLKRENLEQLVRYTEFFKKIRTTLQRQGINDPND